MVCVSFLPKSVPIHAKCSGDGTGERARERRMQRGCDRDGTSARMGRGMRGFPSGGNVCRSGVPKRSAFPANLPKLQPASQNDLCTSPRLAARFSRSRGL
jgi:hypothetical protein